MNNISLYKMMDRDWGIDKNQDQRYGKLNYDLNVDITREDVDNWAFFRGNVLEEEILQHKLFYYEGQKNQTVLDYEDMFTGWILCSPKLHKIINSFVNKNHIQWLKPILIGEQQDKLKDYMLLNVLKHSLCMDKKASSYFRHKENGTISTIKELVLDPKLLDSELHLFRMKETPKNLLVSQEIVEACHKEKIIGIDFDLIPVRK